MLWKAQVESVPKKNHEDTKYCVNLWEEWRNHRLQHTTATIPLLLEMTNTDLQHWMTRFIMEVRKKDGSIFPPNTLHHIRCGIMRHLRTNGKPALDFFKDPEFADFRASIDAEMKHLQAAALGSQRKQAEPLTREEVEILWEKGLLGDGNPQSLVDTMLFMDCYSHSGAGMSITNFAFIHLKSSFLSDQERGHTCNILKISPKTIKEASKDAR